MKTIIRIVFAFLITSLYSCSGNNTPAQESSNDLFKQFAYYENNNASKYRIFVFITNANSEQMKQHAEKQKWSSAGTTMVCYFNDEKGLNSELINNAKDVDKAIDEIWKPNIIARYMHWPTGKIEFTENPYTK